MTNTINKTLAMGALVAAFAAAAAQAETQLKTDANVTTTRTPAVSTPDQVNVNAPVAGSNSFTQSQVMTRLSRAGYSNIASLQKGSDGIWRGTGVKDGTTHNLMFDYQGNISTGVR